jgi:hypothetical protein
MKNMLPVEVERYFGVEQPEVCIYDESRARSGKVERDKVNEFQFMVSLLKPRYLIDSIEVGHNFDGICKAQEQS